MEQSGTVCASKQSVPQAPIVVFGGQDDYLMVAATVEQAVEEIRCYLSTGSGEEQGTGCPKKQYPRLEEFEFYDTAGQRLEPVVAAGQLKDLVVQDSQQEIRDRIRKMFRTAEAKILQETPRNFSANQPPISLPDEAVGFEEFTQQLAVGFAKRQFAPGCNFWRHVVLREC